MNTNDDIAPLNPHRLTADERRREHELVIAIVGRFPSHIQANLRHILTRGGAFGAPQVETDLELRQSLNELLKLRGLPPLGNL